MAKIDYKKYHPQAYCFSEILMGEKLFKLDNEARTFLRGQVNEGKLNDSLNLMTKYLAFKENLDGPQIKELLCRHLALIVYDYVVNTKKISNYQSGKLDDLLGLNGKLEYDDLISLDGDNVFIKLYNNSSREDFKQSLDLLKEGLKPELYERVYKNLRREYDFFMPTEDLDMFLKNDNLLRLDMIIADAINSKNVSFTFKIDEKNMNSFIENINLAKLNNDSIKKEAIIFAYSIFNDNILTTSRLQTITLNRKASFKSNLIIIENGKFNFAKLKKEFSFSYNGTNYLLTRDGVEKQ